jgi:hypothetical protein
MPDRLIKDLTARAPAAGDAIELDDGATSGGNRFDLSATIAALLGASTQTAARASLGITDSPTWNTADQWTLFGDGFDGDVTVSSGLTTLTRDVYYNTLTVSGTGQIATNNFRIFCRVALDLSAAPANAIVARVTATGAGGNGSTAGTGGTAGASITGATVSGGSQGVVGGAGGTTTGVAGAAPAAIAAFCNTATSGGNGGSGGLGSSGAGGTAAAANASTVHQERTLGITTVRGIAFIGGGCPGAPGSGGGGDGTAGGGGGGSGTAPGALFISARSIIRGTNTNQGILSNIGRVGGNGGSAVAGNRGGGGGGGGSSGGYIRLIFETLTGSTITNAIDVTGGNGGAGGNGFGTGVGGAGGGAGGGGYVDIWDLGSGTHTTYQGGGPVVGGAASGVTGGSAGVAATSRTSL